MMIPTIPFISNPNNQPGLLTPINITRTKSRSTNVGPTYTIFVLAIFVNLLLCFLLVFGIFLLFFKNYFGFFIFFSGLKYSFFVIFSGFTRASKNNIIPLIAFTLVTKLCATLYNSTIISSLGDKSSCIFTISLHVLPKSFLLFYLILFIVKNIIFFCPNKFLFDVFSKPFPFFLNVFNF